VDAGIRGGVLAALGVDDARIASECRLELRIGLLAQFVAVS
jgi:hypothetical protein